MFSAYLLVDKQTEGDHVKKQTATMLNKWQESKFQHFDHSYSKRDWDESEIQRLTDWGVKIFKHAKNRSRAVYFQWNSNRNAS